MAAVSYPPTMDALVFRGTRQITFERVPVPTPGPGEVLIKVSNSGICGSDLHGYLGHSARRTAHIPLIMGHEFAGQVVQVGAPRSTESGIANQPSLEPGDRVVVQPQITCRRCPACRSGRANICPNMQIVGIERAGAFAEYVSVPADRVFPIPDSLSERHASLVETLAVEVHLFAAMVQPILRSVAIFGAGAQGLFAVQLARLTGAEQIIVSDLMPSRLALAERLGATHTFQADKVSVSREVSRLTDGWGVDFSVDAVGAPAIRQEATAVLAPGGTLGLVGLGRGETVLDFLPVVNKELSIKGSYCYTDGDFQRALDLVAHGTIEVESMIDNAPLREGAHYFEQLLAPGTPFTKVVLAIGE